MRGRVPLANACWDTRRYLFSCRDHEKPVNQDMKGAGVEAGQRLSHIPTPGWEVCLMVGVPGSHRSFSSAWHLRQWAAVSDRHGLLLFARCLTLKPSFPN